MTPPSILLSLSLFLNVAPLRLIQAASKTCDVVNPIDHLP